MYTSNVCDVKKNEEREAWKIYNRHCYVGIVIRALIQHIPNKWCSRNGAPVTSRTPFCLVCLLFRAQIKMSVKCDKKKVVGPDFFHKWTSFCVNWWNVSVSPRWSLKNISWKLCGKWIVFDYNSIWLNSKECFIWKKALRF